MLRKCHNCQAGLEKESPLCQYCGAVLRHVAGAGHQVDSVVCFSCGGQSSPGSSKCFHCGSPLTQTCPRCAATVLLPGAERCPRCNLVRAEFFGECQRIEREREKMQTVGQRRKVLQSWVLLVFGAGFCVVALHFHLNSSLAYRNAALVIGAIYIVGWLLIMYVSRDTLFADPTRRSTVNEASSRPGSRRDA
jgi:predicted amidophosphoribosyltransferase